MYNDYYLTQSFFVKLLKLFNFSLSCFKSSEHFKIIHEKGKLYLCIQECSSSLKGLTPESPSHLQSLRVLVWYHQDGNTNTLSQKTLWTMLNSSFLTVTYIINHWSALISDCLSHIHCDMSPSLTHTLHMLMYSRGFSLLSSYGLMRNSYMSSPECSWWWNKDKYINLEFLEDQSYLGNRVLDATTCLLKAFLEVLIIYISLVVVWVIYRLF